MREAPQSLYKSIQCSKENKLLLLLLFMDFALISFQKKEYSHQHVIIIFLDKEKQGREEDDN